MSQRVKFDGNVITHLEQVSEKWLTGVLIRSGALKRGSVEQVEINADRGNWSANAILKVGYAPGSQGAMPQRLFLKIVNADLEDEYFGPSEVDYYKRDYADVKDAPIISCYDAVYSQKMHRYHLLLDDLSETHIIAAEKTPDLEYGLALAEALARLHVRWWGKVRLAEGGINMHDPEHIQRFVDIAKPGVKHILRRFSDDLETHWPDMIKMLYAKHPQTIIERSRDAQGFTLIHGDVGEGNILIPRNGTRPLYIIDRQPFDWSLTTWMGVYDLAYAMVLDWDIETRRHLEIPVLRHYHEQVLVQGVEGYSWDQLWEDYRLCVAMGVYIATEYCRGGLNEHWVHAWLPMLKRSLTACDDLDCPALWM